MGTLTGQNIADRAWATLGDTVGTPGTRWGSTECAQYISDGQREVCIELPSAYVLTAIKPMVAGARQTLAGLTITDGVQFLRATCNYDSGGTVPGRAITTRPMEWMNQENPTWFGDASGPIVHTFFDPSDPKTFYVYPQATAGQKIQVVYAASPADIANLAATIVIDDIYSNALQFYLLMRASLKQSNFTRTQAVSLYYQMFLRSLGVKDSRVTELDANKQMVSDGAGVTGGKK